jgi:capsular exopolysaccharide synthesis family protein
VSKFFKALETAEREQRSADGGPVAEDRAASDATSTTAAKGGADPSPAAQAPAAPAAQAAPAAPTAATPAAPPERREATPRPRRPDRVPAAARPAPAAAPATVYGAPVARETDRASGLHAAFPDTFPEQEAEPGQVDDHLVSLLEPTSYAAEQYRAIRLAIENFRRERGTRVVAVSSAGRREGKTMTAINLAGALAQAPDARVALLEVDLRHPSVARYLGLPPGRGLSTYLLDATMAVEAVIQRPAGITFAVVPAGPVSSMPYELLKSPRLTALLAELRHEFDFVVVDTPPVLSYPDVGILRDAVDGFVLVVRAHRTPRELLRDSYNAIGGQRALGVIYNEDERSPAGTYAGEPERGWRNVLGASRVA